ncbi:MAG TPA: hypothetical protein VGB70_14405 [Allosphingosinicella sp.]|jgi:hypothetical protein
MPRPLNPRQREENARFLRALAQTGNARLAARSLGVNRSTYLKRRARHPAFAAAWGGALAAAQAALAAAAPGEPAPTRTRSGRLQLRAAAARAITRTAEHAFFIALATGHSVRAAARQAGFAHSSFHRRAARDPAFAREMEAALEQGADRLEWAAAQSALAGLGLLEGAEGGFSWEEEAAAAPLAPMTPDQALQFLRYRHRARLDGRAGGRPPAPPPMEEVAARILRLVDTIKRQRKA